MGSKKTHAGRPDNGTSESNARKDIDKVVMRLWKCMASDLLENGDQSRFNEAYGQGIVALRDFEFPSYYSLDAYSFKKMYQVQSFGKRFLFEVDKFTSDDLHRAAIDDFVESQAGYGVRNISERTLRVVKRAQEISHEILGDFDFEEYVKHCRWGKRAAKGLKRKDAYLDIRTREVTGTTSQIALMQKIAYGDDSLRKSIKGFKRVRTVKYSLVPKSFKAMRGICPDTIAGGFLSAGLGNYLRHRLEQCTCINLKNAQSIHKKLACQASKTQHLTTADLSKASDSFTLDHLRLLVPKSWLPYIKVARTPVVEVDGKEMNLKSVMLMGSGHTFPLQTILFYVVLKAISDLSGVKGTIRVFGDDCIYPTKMHKFVLGIFDDLGFTINTDKTFSSPYPFRESCGGDYHTGVDVRPYMPQTPDSFGAIQTCAMLYQLLNGLLSKWTHYEIPKSINYLVSQLILRSKDGEVHRGVVGMHGDYQCLLHDIPDFWDVVLPRIFVEDSVWKVKTRLITMSVGKRRKRRILPYYWAALQRAQAVYNEEPFWDPKHCVEQDNGSPFESSKGERPRFRVRNVVQTYVPART